MDANVAVNLMHRLLDNIDPSVRGNTSLFAGTPFVFSDQFRQNTANALLQRVREAWVYSGRWIETHELNQFYSMVLGPAHALPFITEYQNQAVSWFYPTMDPNRWKATVHLLTENTDNMFGSIMNPSAFTSLGGGLGGFTKAGISPQDMQRYEQIATTVRLFGQNSKEYQETPIVETVLRGLVRTLYETFNKRSDPAKAGTLSIGDQDVWQTLTPSRSWL